GEGAAVRTKAVAGDRGLCDRDDRHIRYDDRTPELAAHDHQLWGVGEIGQLAVDHDEDLAFDRALHDALFTVGDVEVALPESDDGAAAGVIHPPLTRPEDLLRVLHQRRGAE